jgi:L-fuculose-phosphate aldolase
MSQQTTLERKRQAVSDYGKRMLEHGLTTGTGGNISARDGDRIAISPSGMPYSDITPDDVPIVDLHGERISGERTPSSESRMHATIHHERDDVGAVVHTHSPYASTFASLNQPIPASHYLIAFAGDQVPVAGYATYGTESLAELAIEALGNEYDACLLKNHGVVAVGATVEAAYERALMVEYCARIHYQALNIGKPSLLSDDIVSDLREIFRSYGQAAQNTDEAAAVAPVPGDDDIPDERASVTDLGVSMVEQGLTKGTGGNVSARRGDRIAINPSGVRYKDVSHSTVPVVDLDGEQVAGELEASSETPMHTMIYRSREDIGGVVHTHSPYASTFASLGKPIPASHYLVAFAGDQIPVTDYATPGTAELGELAVEALGDEYDACLLGHHGVVTVGESAEEAFEVALMVEYCARIHYQACSIGEPALLPDEEIDELTERFADYGQNH